MRGKPPKAYVATDLPAQLKAITERLGNLGFPFDDHTRLVSAVGSELRRQSCATAGHTTTS